MLAAALLGAASSLLVPPGVSLPSRPARPSSRPQRAPAPTCCICINCKLVDRCKLYHWVEEMHEQPHLTEEADFDPADPQVRGSVGEGLGVTLVLASEVRVRSVGAATINPRILTLGWG